MQKETGTETKTAVPEEIIVSRRTTRNFAEESPSKQEIETVIKAGSCAPFAIIGSKDANPLRKFIVLHKDSPERELVQRRLESTSKLITDLIQFNFIRHIWRFFEKLIALKSIPLSYYEEAHFLLVQTTESKGHFLHIREAPYYVIIAERFRSPQVTNFLIRQSVAHCLQNMWLSATAQGLAFQPVSATKFLSSDKKVCKILGINPKEYELEGCLIGYPKKTIAPKSTQIILDEIVTWIQ
jgi:nitroreductase